MANVKVYNMKGEEVGNLDLSDKVFGAEYNEPLIHQAVVTYLCNQRQGTKSTLTRTAAARSLGDRRGLAERVRVPSVRPSGRRAASCSHPSPATSPKR